VKRVIRRIVHPTAVYYTVTGRDSDGLAALCRRHGITDWERVAHLNHLSAPYTIRVGQRLRLK
jgi:hypothetical protein